MSERIPITIIGGGVIGCAIAYEVSKISRKQIVLIERNDRITAENQSSRNSGVIHAGIYYPKDIEPLKARFCVEGNEMLYRFCEKFEVPHKKTGKIVVANNSVEEEYLGYVLDIAYDNGVRGIKEISGKEVRRIEPNVNAKSALYIPTSGIIEPTQLVRKLSVLAQSREVSFLTKRKVTGINSTKSLFEITIKSGETEEIFETSILINASGVYSNEVAGMVNSDNNNQIRFVRGESAKFYKTRRNDISMNGSNVYPVPYGFYQDGRKAEVSLEEFKILLKDKKIIKTVGTHLTPTFDFYNNNYEIGSLVTIGPIPTPVTERDDYSLNLHSEKDYLNKVKKIFPGLKLEDIILHQSGIQTKIKDEYDFIIERDLKYPTCINLIGIDSPGLTSSLAIARYVSDLIRSDIKNI